MNNTPERNTSRAPQRNQDGRRERHEGNRMRRQGPGQDVRPKKWWDYLLNFHTFFIVFSLFIVITLVLFFKKWGIVVDKDYIEKHSIYNDGRDTFDVFMPLLDDQGQVLANKPPHTILFFGNNAFSDDRDSENNVVNLIARQTGATVYNCSIGGSYLTAKEKILKYSDGIDAYNFFWLCVYLTADSYNDYFDWVEQLPISETIPETKEVHHILDTIDMNTVDTICIMYDGSDYLAGSRFYNENDEKDIMTFTGNLAFGLELLQEKYPQTRIIVASPTYAFGIDDDGKYVSSDIKIYGEGVTLSSYMLKECETVAAKGITFIDNIYGTFNEDEAREYLTDNLHLNQKGREKLAKRISSAIMLYDQK